MKKLFLVIFFIVFLSLIVCFPSISTKAARQAVDIFLYTLIPALLPFTLIYNYIRQIANLPGILVWGAAAGYPAGAKMVNDLSASLSHPLLALTTCNLASPNFILVYVGYGLCKSVYYGVIILLSCLLGTGLTNLFFYILCAKNVAPTHSAPIEEQSKSSFSFSSVILESIKSLLVFGGYLLLCSIAAEAIRTLLPISIYWKGICICFLEFTVGLEFLFHSSLSITMLLPIAVFFLSFGSVSIFLQTAACLKNKKLMYRYIPIKFLCALNSVFFYHLITFICKR